MAERSWFFASNGQQQGPVPETQLRDLIARGSVTPDTLVWSEGMAGWQKAGEIPDLMSGASRPPAMPRPGPPPVMAAGASGSALTIDFGVWELFWRGFVVLARQPARDPRTVGHRLDPELDRAPRACAGTTQSQLHRQAMTLVPWYFGAIVLIIVAIYYSVNNEMQWPNYLVDLVQILLYWLFIRWVFANLASNGQPLGLSFGGSFWAYLGWSILFGAFHPHHYRLGLGVSPRGGAGSAATSMARDGKSFTTARASNISGARWRHVICCAFIIPIPMDVSLDVCAG